MLYEEIVKLLGPVPPGFEPVVYFGAVLVLLWFLQFVSRILWTVLSWIGDQ